MLFSSDKTPASELRERLTRLEKALFSASAEDLADPEWVDRTITSVADETVPTLDRSGASFRPIPRPDGGTDVECTIRFTGSDRYFQWRVEGVEQRPITAAFGEDPRTSIRERPAMWIVLRQTFAAGTGPETVKAWAKEEVDAIEQNLNALRAVVTEHAGLLRERGTKVAADRLRQLQELRALEEGLGNGI